MPGRFPQEAVRIGTRRKMASIEGQVDDLQYKVDQLQRQFDELEEKLKKVIHRIGEIEIQTGSFPVTRF